LVTKRSLRWSEGVCVLEGPDLIEAALVAGVEFEGVFVANDATDKFQPLVERLENAGIRAFSLESGVVEKIADATTPQPIVASVRMPMSTLSDITPVGTVIVLHEVRDPGNVGTVIRSADASGASAVILTGHSVDPYNPKTLRATAGSIFHLPVVVCESLEETLSWFHRDGAPSYATVVRGGENIDDVLLPPNHLFLLGNEAEGLSVSEAALATHTVTIPMSGKAESLNVSIAAALTLFAGQRARHLIR
jgi:RNA methyltransferase, TrmH family